jgi:hypothetical protein
MHCVPDDASSHVDIEGTADPSTRPPDFYWDNNLQIVLATFDLTVVGIEAKPPATN